MERASCPRPPSTRSTTSAVSSRSPTASASAPLSPTCRRSGLVTACPGRHRQRAARPDRPRRHPHVEPGAPASPPSTRTATSTTSSGYRSGRPRRSNGAGPPRRWSPTTPCPHASTATSSPTATTPSSTAASSVSPTCNWPTEYRYPDRTYHDSLDISVGGVDFALRHEKGETDDHTVTWQADTKVLCCGDLFIWASPNAGNPQKVQRYPREWADALRRMLTLEAEFLLPGHGFPVVGADRVRTALSDTADLLDSLVDQTLAVMNEGGRLDDAIHSVSRARRLGRAALPAARLRRARVHRPHGLATVRRLVGRQPGHPQAGARARPGGRAGRAGRRRGRPGRPSPGAAGAGRRGAARRGPRPTGRCAWPATWPSTPGWPPGRPGRPADPPAGVRGPGRPGHFHHGPGRLHLGRQRVGRRPRGHAHPH